MANKPWVVTTTCKHCNFIAEDIFRTWEDAAKYARGWSSTSPYPLDFKIRKMR